MKKEFIFYEDASQRASLEIAEKSNDFIEIRHQVQSTETKEIQSVDFFNLHKSDLLEVANWIVETYKK